MSTHLENQVNYNNRSASFSDKGKCLFFIENYILKYILNDKISSVQKFAVKQAVVFSQVVFLFDIFRYITSL
jgi:hypothetical protein